MKKVVQYCLLHPLYGALIILLLVGFPFFGMLSALLAASLVVFITLQTNLKHSAYVLIGAAAPCLVHYFWFKQTGGYDILLVMCIFVWVLALVLKNTYSWRLVLQITWLVGFLGVCLVHVIHPNIHDYWQGWLNIALSSMQDNQEFLSILSNIGQEKIDAIIVYASKFLTGLLLFYFFLVSLLGLFVGRYGQAKYTDAMPSFREEVLNISLGRVDVIFFFCCLLGVMFKIDIFMDSIMIPCLPFLIDALSLLHRLGRNNNSVRYSLYFMYILMWFFWYLVLPIVAFVGMTDSWFNFRKRLSNS